MALDRLLQSVPLPNDYGSRSLNDNRHRGKLTRECEHEILEVHSAMTGGDYIIKCQRCPKEWKDFAILVADRSR